MAILEAMRGVWQNLEHPISLRRNGRSREVRTMSDLIQHEVCLNDHCTAFALDAFGSATSDPSKTSVSATPAAVPSPQVIATRRFLKRTSTVAGLVEPSRHVSVPVDSSSTVPCDSAVAASPRRRILGKTPSCEVARSGDVPTGESTTAPSVSVLAPSPRRRILRKTSSCGVPASADGTPANVGAGSASDRMDSVLAEEFVGSSELIMLSRLLQRRTSDPAGVDSARQQPATSDQPPVPVPSAVSDDSLEAMLAAVMELPTSPDEVTPEAACDHDVAGEGSTASVASGPPAAEEVWRRFTPTVIDPAKCLARTFNGGAGGQCKRKPQAGEAICGNCKKLAHGRVDGPIPDGKLQIFLRSSRGE